MSCTDMSQQWTESARIAAMSHNPHDVDSSVRISGQPGVRHRQLSGAGSLEHQRVNPLPTHGEVRPVPIAVLSRVRVMLTEDGNVRPAAEVFRELHALLEPWF